MPTINRDWKKVYILSYIDEIDEYGQLRQNEPTKTEIEMFYRLYNQSNTDNPLYIDVDMIGLTKCSTITNKNEIEIDGSNYSVKYVIPSGRFYQILMQWQK